MESGSDRASTFVFGWFKEFDSPEHAAQDVDAAGRRSALDDSRPVRQRRFRLRSLPVGAAVGVAVVAGFVLVVSLLAGCSARRDTGPAVGVVSDTDVVESGIPGQLPGPSVPVAPPVSDTVSPGTQPVRSEPTDADRARLSAVRTSAAAMFAVVDAELSALGSAVEATGAAAP